MLLAIQASVAVHLIKFLMVVIFTSDTHYLADFQSVSQSVQILDNVFVYILFVSA